MSGDKNRNSQRTARRSPARSTTQAGRRALLALAALLCLTALAGCTVPGGLLSGKPPGPRHAIEVVPGDGAHGVRAEGRFEVRVPAGRLQRVVVKRAGDTGQASVAGRISPDRKTWRPSAGPLEPGAKYTVDAVAVDGKGHRASRHTTFTTYVSPNRLIGYFTPENKATVGTGMIVSLQFNRPIARRAVVERAVSVTAEPDVEIAAHWFGNQRLDFRPRERWQPGTEVTVDLRLRGVKAGPHAFGTQQKTVRFRIGRDQTSVIDAATHTLTVSRDDKVTATLPVTAGDRKNPTYNGKMVILERHKVTRMNSRTVGFGGEYDIPDVPHAMRLTPSGTFLHGNYWAPPEVFGWDNTSHGCVGLRDIKGGGRGTPAGWLFAQSMVGDIVEVRNSKDRTVAPDNGLGGWNMPWEQWRQGSVL
ncbi:L,D-transpeptidase [Streptomyces pinistramenti]|uniref:L,D-transpeptidase n=1 Tax=Streptomyces pinistramenti TaxID=2884812 RepID=UPI001D06A926|nr:Ig-like domain-containing protein [Streptomyces pinistramenti]MCB5908371.1 Ig-like domain-containing protein [Streptomyces pinistramenti]